MKKRIWGLTAITIFASSGMVSTASAVAIADGTYQMNILPYISGVLPDYTSNDSQIAFNTLPGSSSSNYITDNTGDELAGQLGLSISGGNIGFTSFQMDCIGGTLFGGGFCQYMDDFNMAGGTTTDSETSFDLTGRLVSIDGGAGQSWDYAGFTTDTVTTGGVSDTGVSVVNVGDINGDGIDDYTAVFKSAGELGIEWGGFAGTPYFEVWNVEIVSAVPVPAAIWLFGSGLIGLFAWARRKSQIS
jgi:hypothetical protein